MTRCSVQIPEILLGRYQKGWVLAVICCLAVISGYSQKKAAPVAPASKAVGKKAADLPVVLSWGDKLEVPKHHLPMAFWGSPKAGYLLVFSNGNKSIVIKQFDAGMHGAGSNTIPLDMMPSAFENETFITLKKKVYWLYSNWEKESAVERVYAREVDQVHLKVGPELLLLQTQHKLDRSPLEAPKPVAGISVASNPAYGTHKYQFVLSSDSSKLLVRYRLKNSDKPNGKGIETDGMFLFDENLKHLSGDEYALPYSSDRMTVEECRISQTENIYLLAKIYESSLKDATDKGSVPFHYEVIRYASGSKKADPSPLHLEQGVIKNVHLMEMGREDLVCTGFYSADAGGPVKGVYLVKLNPLLREFTSYRKGYYEFPPEVKKVVAPAKKGAAGPKKEVETGLADLEFRDFLMHPDGSITITGEEQRITLDTLGGSHERPEVSQVFHYNNLMAMHIDSSGNVAWIKKIAKHQRGKNAGGDLSCKWVACGNQVAAFFLDDSRNSKLKAEQVPAPYVDGSGGIFVCERLDEKGKDTRTVVFDTKLIKQTVIPLELFQASGNTLIATAAQDEVKTFYLLELR